MNASFSSGCSVKPVKPYITESPEEEENKRKRAGFRRTAIYWRTDITDLRHMGKSYRQMQAFFFSNLQSGTKRKHSEIIG
nr:hypothetical protein [Bacteroides hominis (ex Liu et al. 2022)]MDV6133761.1 hypothetical protein [Bacteroides hominis (ex Liu et al. 2022)]